MKFIKTLTVCAFVALGLSCGAQAASKTFYIVGSTAFRGQTTTAIMNLLGSTNYVASTGQGTLPSGSTADGYTYGYAMSGTAQNVGGANNALFIGNISGVGDVIIHTTWTGSESGIYACAIDSGSGAAQPFIYEGVAGSQPVTTTGSTNVSTGTNVVPDGDMSDTFQGTSQWAGGNTVTYANGSHHTTATLTESTNSPVGVTWFAFGVSQSGSYDGITNITTEQAKNLYSNLGYMPVQMFVPTFSDAASTVYAMGRDPDSGTRLTTFGEIGMGNLASTVQVFCYSGTDGSTGLIQGAGSTVNSINFVPASTVNNIAVNAGNGGFNSGGNLAKTANDEIGTGTSGPSPFQDPDINFGGPAEPGSCLMIYAGISDIANLTNGKVLTFNGVTQSAINVENGSYPLWTYEHMYFRPGASANAQQVGNAISLGLKNTYANGTGTTSRSSMNVERVTGNKDGGSLITPGTF